jgi:hypothetical protein
LPFSKNGSQLVANFEAGVNIFDIITAELTSGSPL